jgi:hypothetical protein
VLDLFLENHTASHENLLLEHFIALIVRAPKSLLIDDLVDFVYLDEASPLDVHRSADFAHSAIATWIVLH